MLDELGEFCEQVEKYQKLQKLRLPSFKVFKSMFSMEQTRVVETLINFDGNETKVNNLSLDILKYAISYRDKVKVDNRLLSQLYNKYRCYFEEGD